MYDLTIQSANAKLHADTTTRRALLREVRFAAFAALVMLFVLSLPIACLIEETPQNAALIVGLYLVACIGIGVGLVLDGLRRALHKQAVACALTAARLRDREAALRDAAVRAERVEYFRTGEGAALAFAGRLADCTPSALESFATARREGARAIVSGTGGGSLTESEIAEYDRALMRALGDVVAQAFPDYTLEGVRAIAVIGTQCSTWPQDAE
jgi:hypothetical protein